MSNALDGIGTSTLNYLRNLAGAEPDATITIAADGTVGRLVGVPFHAEHYGHRFDGDRGQCSHCGLLPKGVDQCDPRPCINNLLPLFRVAQEPA